MYSIRPLTHSHLMVRWDLNPNLNNCASCHAHMYGQRHNFGIQEQISIAHFLLANMGEGQDHDFWLSLNWQIELCMPTDLGLEPTIT